MVKNLTNIFYNIPYLLKKKKSIKLESIKFEISIYKFSFLKKCKYSICKSYMTYYH